jgi:phenylacetate-coenzyme A ligase PaaK-like adenylate-forming protein
MRQLRNLLRLAAASTFYKRKFTGSAWRDIVDIEDFREKVPTTTFEELVAEKMRSGDPCSSRRCMNKSSQLLFQLEYGAETPVYLALDQRDLRKYAEALTGCWSLLGLGRGDSVAIFDYGTSPVSYLASSAFTPYLGRGAADLLGCLPICNDGLANMSQRALEILKFVRPHVLYLRADCLEPLCAQSISQIVRLSAYTRALVVTENEGLLAKSDQNAYEKRLGLPIYRLLRSDAAMFLAMECPACRLFHSSQNLYHLETMRGVADDVQEENCLVITNRFARTCPTVRYLSHIQGAVHPAGCPRRPQDLRIAA